jgi:hypothetical protein
MNQKLAIALFFGGLAAFLSGLGEFFSSHETWQSLSTPMSIGHIMYLTSTFCMTIAGALGTQLPRSKNTRVNDRLPKESIEVTMIQKERENEN